jgi:hypothetical protein
MPEMPAFLATNDSQEQTSEDKPGFLKRLFLGTTAQGFIARMTLYVVFLYLLVFVFGFVWAWFFPEGSANVFGFIRNMLEIVFILSAIIIIISIGILIVQIARFVNLLRSEIKPITEDTKAAVKNIRVTAEFVQKHGIEPIIRIQSFLFGLMSFLVEIVHIARLLQQGETASSTDEVSNENSDEDEEDE